MKTGKGPSRKANIWTARVIPVLLLALIIYSAWVFTQVIVVDYLLDPPPALNVPRRIGAAIVLLILFYLLLTLVLACYVRLAYTIIRNPGFVPRGPQWHIQEAERKKPKSSQRRSRRRPSHNEAIHEKDLPDKWLTQDYPAPREDEFWKREIFICSYDGRPPFCSHCLNYKLDRSHHCSEVNRCVRKMDHFCPWVGGIISETSYKFFIQFTFYGALFTGYALIVVAYYFAERRHVEPGYLNVHWIVVIALAGLFCLFGAGMTASSLQLTWINTTTVENLTKSTKIHYLAVYMPRPEETLRKNEAGGNPDLRTITYPRPPEEQFAILEQHGANVTQPTVPTLPIQPSVPPVGTLGAPNSRTFAILQTTPGTNPWNCGSALENIRQVMGTRLIDWFVPIRPSPCANHDSPTSMYKLNPELEKFKRAAGIEHEDRRSHATTEPSERKRRRHGSHGRSVQSESDGTQTAESKRTHHKRHSSRRGSQRDEERIASTVNS